MKFGLEFAPQKRSFVSSKQLLNSLKKYCAVHNNQKSSFVCLSFVCAKLWWGFQSNYTPVYWKVSYKLLKTLAPLKILNVKRRFLFIKKQAQFPPKYRNINYLLKKGFVHFSKMSCFFEVKYVFWEPELSCSATVREHVQMGGHSREAAGLNDLGLGTVLLQMADVSASSTSCCQWLRHKNNRVSKSSGCAGHLIWIHILCYSMDLVQKASSGQLIWL